MMMNIVKLCVFMVLYALAAVNKLQRARGGVNRVFFDLIDSLIAIQIVCSRIDSSVLFSFLKITLSSSGGSIDAGYC